MVNTSGSSSTHLSAIVDEDLWKTWIAPTFVRVFTPVPPNGFSLDNREYGHLGMLIVFSSSFLCLKVCGAFAAKMLYCARNTNLQASLQLSEACATAHADLSGGRQ